MKQVEMALDTILLFSLVAVFNSCIGQNTTRVANDNSAIATGDTVSEISKNIFAVYQDKNNTYWFGSNEDGVYHYDGKTTIHYTTNDGLCQDKIWKIEGDKSGNIYFTTADGCVSKYSGQRFTTLSSTSDSDSEWKLQPDDLWFKGAQDSGVVYRYDGKNLYRLTFPETKAGEEFIAEHPRSEYPFMTFSPYDVYSIYRDSKGNIWFGTGTLGACRYDGKSFTWISEEEMGFGDLAFGIRSILEDRDGKFWFSNILGRYTVCPDDSSGPGKSLNTFIKEEGIPDSGDNAKDDHTYFMSGVKDRNGELWMATYSAGVWRYDGEKLTHYPVKEGDKTVTLFSIYMDNGGDLWLGTHEAGAYKYSGKTFEKFNL